MIEYHLGLRKAHGFAIPLLRALLTWAISKYKHKLRLLSQVKAVMYTKY